MDFTPRQRRAYRLILEFYKNYGKVPGVNEFKHLMELYTRQDAHYLLMRFVQMGLLEKERRGVYVPTDRMKGDMTKEDVVASLRDILDWVETNT